ncbi:MAG TPA: hypothetical protein VMJ10_34705 [Kofleriaceae bacterium]|nr:hypothetical protein [Kofleriaceae bacterium]
MTRVRARVACTLLLLAFGAPAFADDDFAGATIIYARGGSLYRADPRGKGETEIAKLPAKTTVRALRTDATGKVLLADLDGAWQWMPLDGSTTQLAPLPCANGPAQLAEDGACVFCRADHGSQIVNLTTGRATVIDVPAPGARLAGLPPDRKLVWADAGGVWTAPPARPKQATRVAPDAPLRGFLPSPDGTRALGIYADEVYVDTHKKAAADVLMGFQLDGQGARRKAIETGVPVEWSHDSQWVLVQDRATACLVRATGGEYKCWKGYTAGSIAPDGKFALVFGGRPGSAKKPAPPPPRAGEAEGEDLPPPPPDVDVPLPVGPLALYRVRLEGSAYTETPALVAKIVDGAAVWVPASH